MPICKNCHSRISKFDKDICPVCGNKNPLDGVSSDTIEITQGLDVSDPLFKTQCPRKRKKVFLYFSLIGWLGAGFFYLRYKMLSVLYILLNLAIIGGLGFLFYCLKLNGFGFLISLGISYVMNIIIGLFYLLAPNVKDGVKELII